MKLRCLFSGLLLLFATGATHAQAGPDMQVKPNAQGGLNVLFIAVDDLRPSLGCYGDTVARTPNIDRLAERGLLFERAYCQQALCGPSRASLMTGRRPDALRVYDLKTHFRETVPDVITLPQYFKQNGYFTQAFGKVYHAHPAQPDPPSWSVPEQLLDIPKRDEYLLPANRVRGFINPMEKGTATEAVEAPDNAYQDGQVAQAAIEALQSMKGKPFFLAVGFKRPHLPFTAPKKYWDLYERTGIPLPPDRTPPECTPEEAALRYDWQPHSGELRGYTDMPSSGPVSLEKSLELIHGYYACVSYVDAQIGRVLEALKQLGLEERTIVVLWSDHGYHLGEKGLWGKKDNTEMATRVPLILSVPGQARPGAKTRALVELVDLYPTLAGLCGLPLPAHLEGTSFAPLLDGKSGSPGAPWKKAAFSQYPRQNNTVMGYSVRTGRFRYNEYVELASGKILDRELYRPAEDPYETRNLAGEPAYAGEIKKLENLLKAGWKGALP